tara:strand:- start:1452 stop:1652 length:201 start_codon:yes stop_codon:yes gene_type:complete
MSLPVNVMARRVLDLVDSPIAGYRIAVWCETPANRTAFYTVVAESDTLAAKEALNRFIDEFDLRKE